MEQPKPTPFVYETTAEGYYKIDLPMDQKGRYKVTVVTSRTDLTPLSNPVEIVLQDPCDVAGIFYVDWRQEYVIPPTPTPLPTPTPYYMFVQDGDEIVLEQGQCQPPVWLRGRVSGATKQDLENVYVRVVYPDGHREERPIQPDGTHEDVPLPIKGPCTVTLITYRGWESIALSPSVEIKYTDLCKGRVFVVNWKRNQ